MGKYVWILTSFLLGTEAFATDIRKEVKDIQRQKAELNLKHHQLLGEMAAFEKKLQDLSLENEEKKAYITQYNAEISQKLPLLVRLARSSPLRLLVDPTTSHKTLRGLALVRSFTASLKHQLQRLQEGLRKNASLSEDLEEKTHSYAQLLQKINLQNAHLTTVQGQKIESLKKDELNRLAGENDINVLLDEARATLSQKKQTTTAAAAAVQKGLPFRWLERPVLGKIIENQALQKGFSPNSQGVIFEAQKNADVLAPSHGKIAFKGPFQTQDEILILDHGQKVYTVLMGMHKIDVEMGQTVYPGQKLGTLAGYGKEPPKLYLELRQKGKAIDPKPYFAE